MRFKEGRAYGQSYDPGGINHVSAGPLLNIIGEDPLTLGRKNIGAWEGQLRLKLMLLSNRVLNFNDPGGVLPSRFIKLHFGVSFFGREDPYLKDKLFAELPGIAARCVAAYQRLCRRGRFIQPASGEALERAVLAASDPFTAMALECFEPDPGGSVVKSAAYWRFEQWCEENGRMDIRLATPSNKFGSAPHRRRVRTTRQCPTNGPRNRQARPASLARHATSEAGMKTTTSTYIHVLN